MVAFTAKGTTEGLTLIREQRPCMEAPALAWHGHSKHVPASVRAHSESRQRYAAARIFSNTSSQGMRAYAESMLASTNDRLK
jgi:hypothetical protein